MKKVLGFFPIIFLIFFMISCEKKDLAIESKPEKKKVELSSDAELTARDFDEDVIEYNLMTPAEKYKLWADHWEKAKEFFSGKSESTKVAMLDSMMAAISENSFDSTKTEYSVLNGYWIPKWQNDLTSVFTDDEIYDLSFNPKTDSVGKAAPPDLGFDLGGDGAVNCFCHVGTNGFSCKKLSVGFPNIGYDYGTCEQGVQACTYKRYGCSWLWMSSCNGNHCNYG
jgi:hypothetical protein